MLKKQKNVSIKKENIKSKKNLAESFLEFIKSLVIALLLALLIKATVVEAYGIPTPSMESTLMSGDYVIGNRFIYGIKIPFTDIRLPAFKQPQRGDLIIFKPPLKPDEKYVKRCIGVPGDTIQFVNKRIYINGELYEDSEFVQYLTDFEIPLGSKIPDPYHQAWKERGVKNDGYRPFPPFRDNSEPIIVPENKYFMVGDNRDNSLDSRMWGFVDKKNILGELLIVLWSWNLDDPEAPEVEWKKPLTVIENTFYNIIHFPQRMRWERVLHTPKS